jgi:hypothetical protein
MSDVDPKSGLHEGEVRIRPSTAHRRRAAFSAGITVGAVLGPVGLVLAILSHNWGVLVLCVFASAVIVFASFFGQAHNEVFVGPRGIRRVSRDCDLVASWSALRSVEVKVPGNRIVVFTVNTTGVDVERLTRGHSNSAEALVRHPPEGFEFRLEREAADALVAQIAERRPELKGVGNWDRASRPT